MVLIVGMLVLVGLVEGSTGAMVRFSFTRAIRVVSSFVRPIEGVLIRIQGQSKHV